MAVPSDSWPPSFILGFSCIVFLVISGLGTGIFLIYVRRIRPRIQARKTAHLRGASTSKAVDEENKVERGPLPYSNVAVNPSAVWPALMAPQPDSGSKPPEPQLPWPVLAVLPSLRPKDPVHVRMKNAVMRWNKDEVKHEPFTVADVMRAMEEASTQAPMQGSTSAPSNAEPANRPNVAVPSSRTMPEIVVHPADGKPSFSPALEEWSVTGMSEVSTATISSVSHTESDPETPLLASPRDHSPKVYFSSSPPIAPMASLRVPIYPLSARDDDRAIAVNVSNFSGQKFVLSTPPMKRYAHAARAPGQRGPPQLGLGFVRGSPGKSASSTDLADIYESDDNSLDISSSSLGVNFDAPGVIAAPPSLASSQFAYDMPSKTITTCATDGHSQSSQSTWNGGHPVHSRLPYLRGANPFYDSRSGSGSGEGESMSDATPATPANSADADADADTNTISEENYFECSAEFEEDITVQMAAYAYAL